MNKNLKKRVDSQIKMFTKMEEWISNRGGHELDRTDSDPVEIFKIHKNLWFEFGSACLSFF